MNNYKTITLTEVLSVLESEEEGDKPLLFINPTGTLETFFKYKGHLKYFSELNAKYLSDKSLKDKLKFELNGMFEVGMQYGYWTVINFEGNTNLNILEFLSNFDFKDKDILIPSKIKNKDFCLANNILRKENDKDFEGTQGCFKIQEKFKLILLAIIKEEQIAELLKNNPQLNANIIIVHDR